MSLHKGTRAFFQLFSLLQTFCNRKKFAIQTLFSLSSVKFNSTHLIARILHKETLTKNVYRSTICFRWFPFKNRENPIYFPRSWISKADKFYTNGKFFSGGEDTIDPSFSLTLIFFFIHGLSKLNICTKYIDKRPYSNTLSSEKLSLQKVQVIVIFLYNLLSIIARISISSLWAYA